MYFSHVEQDIEKLKKIYIAGLKSEDTGDYYDYTSQSDFFNRLVLDFYANRKTYDIFVFDYFDIICRQKKIASMNDMSITMQFLKIQKIRDMILHSEN